jgi:hypothetical protein
MVISTAYYGWGAKDRVSHVTSFLGITVTFKRLTLHRVESLCSLLASSSRGLMVWDNFQWGQEEMTMEIGRLMTRP